MTYNDEVRADWPQVHLFMVRFKDFFVYWVASNITILQLEQVLTLKFSQYPGLWLELRATGQAQLVQVSWQSPPPSSHLADVCVS